MLHVGLRVLEQVFGQGRPADLSVLAKLVRCQGESGVRQTSQRKRPTSEEHDRGQGKQQGAISGAGVAPEKEELKSTDRSKKSIQ